MRVYNFSIFRHFPVFQFGDLSAVVNRRSRAHARQPSFCFRPGCRNNVRTMFASVCVCACICTQFLRGAQKILHEDRSRCRRQQTTVFASSLHFSAFVFSVLLRYTHSRANRFLYRRTYTEANNAASQQQQQRFALKSTPHMRSNCYSPICPATSQADLQSFRKIARTFSHKRPRPTCVTRCCRRIDANSNEMYRITEVLYVFSANKSL